MMISICIANYNGEKLIRDCLNSILAQKTTCSYEIIVHDDASTDNSCTIIKREYPKVTLIESSKNVGFCESNNRMIKLAAGNYYLILNNDAVLLPGALETLYTGIASHPDDILSLPQYDHDTMELLDFGMRMDLFANPIPQKKYKGQEVAMVMGSLLLIPENLWNQIGGFPNFFQSIAEDMYVCCAARILGRQVRCLDDAGYKHRVGNSFGGGKIKNKKLSTTYKRRKLSERNKTYVILITYPTLTLLILLPTHLLLLIFEGCVLSVLLRDTTPLKTIYLPVFSQIIHNRKEISNLRKKLQEIRECSTWDFFRKFDIIPQKLKLILLHGAPSIN